MSLSRRASCIKNKSTTDLHHNQVDIENIIKRCTKARKEMLKNVSQYKKQINSQRSA